MTRSPLRATQTDQAEGSSSKTSPESSPASQASRGVLWAVLSNITMRFASVAVTAVLARLLSKEDFGVFAVALAVYLVVSSLAELGMGSAVARSPMEPADIAPTVSTISILVSGATGIAMAVSAPLLASALGQPAAAEPIRVLSLCLLLTGSSRSPVRNWSGSFGRIASSWPLWSASWSQTRS